MRKEELEKLGWCAEEGRKEQEKGGHVVDVLSCTGTKQVLKGGRGGLKGGVGMRICWFIAVATEVSWA
jgi:hypothetical protein